MQAISVDRHRQWQRAGAEVELLDKTEIERLTGKYRKIKTSQGKIFTDSMASGGVLKDYVSQYFGFWVGFQLGPSKKDLNIAFNGRENRQKG